MTSDERITDYERVGLTFEVTDSGPVSGRPVVLLHGFPTDRTSWRHIEPLLHEAGCRTFAPDQRGYSPRASPRGRAEYRLEELVADALTLVDLAGTAGSDGTGVMGGTGGTGHAEPVHLVGHDWGGAVAWLVAGNHPERIASVTVLSTPHPAALSRALKTRDQLRRSWYMGAFQLPWLPERAVAARFRQLMVGGGLPAEDVERYAAHLARPEALTGPINWYRAARSSHVRAHRVTVPSTYVWGNRDFALGPLAAQLTREHVTGPYEFVELTAGHWLPEKRPEECAAAIVSRVRSAD
ncbi:alpha/beta hydrolase [Humibacillus sp. DSM 29435]|uniref:alpha/beta fold hydrolase n=1 Tax=Humibacillus sp. DSM 29435 TaxID=1869167 RepID=UPI000872F5D6|nr:alpha/beta fold hydrolase [Humibacillus sp. DSM 29435]OFE15325.1 alpha/beta hydrolase [Humibacillus sp. DSM 29435]